MPQDHSSLQFLSKLSSELGPSIKQHSEAISSMCTDGYKLRLKAYMEKERFGKENSQNYSRYFREKQSRRMFDQLHRLRGGLAQTYEELEQLHREQLLGKRSLY
jgi:hypothetical protein